MPTRRIKPLRDADPCLLPPTSALERITDSNQTSRQVRNVPIGDITRFNADCVQQHLWSRLGTLLAHLSAMMDSVTMVVLVVVKASRPGRDAGKGG